jgi:predicted RNA binding protein YcfA (HicA-like mRNA interferase family)
VALAVGPIVCTIHTTSSREVIRLLVREGWVLVAQRGSHRQFKHGVRPGRVTVPHPVKDIKPGTLASIYRQSGLKK